jgi:hypothetical protein
VGEEWNFAYVLPQKKGAPVKLVVLSLLQMGWVESPRFFCAASETAQDIAVQHIERPMGTCAEHKFTEHTLSGEDVKALTKSVELN